MTLKTAIAIAVATAFAVPFTASAEADKAKSEAGATAQGGFAALDKNKDGHLSRDETRYETWANRFSELDKDNDGRLSQSEFDAMQAGAGSTAADRKPGTPKK